MNADESSAVSDKPLKRLLLALIEHIAAGIEKDDDAISIKDVAGKLKAVLGRVDLETVLRAELSNSVEAGRD